MPDKKFRFGVIMPHRNDRPLFLEQFHRIMARQTIQPDFLEIVDYEPLSEEIDITQRYRTGYDNLRGKDLDCILFCEIDDWYSPIYIETMLKGWVDHGCPDIFGTDYTTYYHLRLDKSFTFHHKERSSMMSTLIKADLELEWPEDNYPYTDMYLWLHSRNRKTFAPGAGYICIGLKHGMGLTGGSFHTNKLKMYSDKGMNFKKVVGETDFAFYRENFPLAKIKMDGREVIIVE